MDSKINIVYLAHKRQDFAKLTFKFLSDSKDKFHITIYDTIEHPSDSLPKLAKDYNLNFTYKKFPKTGVNNYLLKIDDAMSMPFEYSIKLDEDVLLGPAAWGFFLDNVHYLDDEKNILLTPALSNGIPSIDSFIKYNLSEEEKNKLYDIFNKTYIPEKFWGADYTHITKHLQVNGYNPNLFWNAVSKVKHHYKGIHPIRVNLDAQLLMNDLIINNYEKFFEKRNFKIEKINAPYFCNSIFAIKTQTWKKIIGNKKLKQCGGVFVDSFDEVPINEYRDKYDKSFLYIVNAFGIHVMYNTFHDPMLAVKIGVDHNWLLKKSMVEEMNFYNRFYDLVQNGQNTF